MTLRTTIPRLQVYHQLGNLTRTLINEGSKACLIISDGQNIKLNKVNIKLKQTKLVTNLFLFNLFFR